LVYRYNNWPEGSNILEPEPQTPTVRMRRKHSGTETPSLQDTGPGDSEVWTAADIYSPNDKCHC
jgi:hypothetical protein